MHHEIVALGEGAEGRGTSVGLLGDPPRKYVVVNTTHAALSTYYSEKGALGTLVRLKLSLHNIQSVLFYMI